MERQTNQKKLIYKALCHTKTHPSVEELYQIISAQGHKIGIATIYRNLNRFVAEGKAICITSSDGKEHYDVLHHPHVHFCCSKCGKIIDISDELLTSFLERRISTYGKSVDHYKILLDGVCNGCKKKIS